MSEEIKHEELEVEETTPPTEDAAPEGAGQPTPEEASQPDPLAEAQAALAVKDDQLLRLAAEYDNFRKRSAKEKTDAYESAKADAAKAFLPVYDNLQRALAQSTEDEAFLKGVEMTMSQLKSVLESLGITEIAALNQPFDPNLHNAVMHVEDENAGENTVVEVFQTGFKMGEKVIRFAMVKVAN
jgi:molecular chaperone GrpE